jgi:MFS family permease
MSRYGSPGLLFATMYPQTIMSMMVLTPPVLAERISSAYGLPAEVAGLYAATSFLFVAIGALSTASIISRVGPLRLSFACIVAGGGALALFGLGSLGFMVLATALMGLCYGPLTPAGQQAVANGGPIANIALFLSIRQTAVPLGGMLAGFIVPALVLWTDLETALWTIGGLASLSGLVAGCFAMIRRERRHARPAARSGFLGPLKMMLGHRALLAMSLASVIYGALQLIVGSLLVVFVMTALHRDLVTAGMMLAISQGAAMCGRIGWGFLADRIGRLRATLGAVGVGMAVGCVLACLLTPESPNWMIAAVAFLLGGTASGWNGVFLASLIRSVPPEQAGFAASGALLFSYLGIIIGPPLFGALAALVGFSIAFFVLALVALCGAGLCFMSTADP